VENGTGEANRKNRRIFRNRTNDSTGLMGHSTDKTCPIGRRGRRWRGRRRKRRLRLLRTARSTARTGNRRCRFIFLTRFGVSGHWRGLAADRNVVAAFGRCSTRCKSASNKNGKRRSRQKPSRRSKLPNHKTLRIRLHTGSKNPNRLRNAMQGNFTQILHSDFDVTISKTLCSRFDRSVPKEFMPHR
jgi:hypothetical protein